MSSGGALALEAAAAGLLVARFQQAADAIAAALPRAERVRLRDSGHVPDPEALAAVLARFFGSR